MWSSTILGLCLLAASITEAAPSLAPAVKADYDAIIVGGGPSGLAAASGLGRVRRNVLLVDSGEYRNNATRHAHDIIGYDGVTPAWLRFSARQQIGHYDTIALVNGTVTDIQPEQSANGTTLFTVSITYPENKPVTFTTRKIVLGTGMKDILPETPGIEENWGKGIFWCPWCDGTEHADQALGILAELSSAVTTIREILTLNTDIVLFVNGTDTPEYRAEADLALPGWERYLQLHDVKLENRSISSVTRLRDGATPFADPSLPTNPEHDLFQVDFTEGGESILRNAFLADFPSEQKSTLGQDVGVQLLGTKLSANSSKGLATNIDGIYAIGDANSDNITNVPHAFFTGKRTAVYLHVQLERENSGAQIGVVSTSSRKREEESLRSIWERVNHEDDITYAGEFDQ
ncbi:hypothetical protein DOTSEDRAFT_74609 [Dothistroma septosporum NZE10]|uniref:FAD/NAD(P)-binding domain-containing protein n=1 Tax=Dothistroma septosporum (strain NZE10 / CBS 128990) TaxID=675120 RepID=N1PER8_DOTSN|nr:hypothetical protein DOTSEDRAFT_74609 [Dothistroma septosporum NZE10]